MEVLAQSSAVPRSLFMGSERDHYWQPRHHQPLIPHQSLISHSKYGPQPPPSPPYEMNKGNQAPGGGPSGTSGYSLPPISDLLAYSRAEGGRPSDRPTGWQSPPHGHRRQASSGQASSRHHSPISTTSSHPGANRDMQPPLTLQPAHNIARIDPALFNESRSRQVQASPTSSVSSRPTLDTAVHYPRSQPLASPYPNSAPVRSHYADMSPRSAVSASPYYTQPYHHEHHHSHSLSVPGPATPRTAASDSPMQTYHPGLPPHRHAQDDSSSQAGRPLLPLYPGESPKMLASRTLPSVTFAGYHPYPQHSRDPSRGSTDAMPGSRPYATTSPSSRQDQPADSTSSASASTLQDRYQCPTCTKAFSRPSSLRIHSHSHTGEKPFICPRPGCGKAFSVRSNMKRHERGCHIGPGLGMPSDHGMDRRRELAPAEED